MKTRRRREIPTFHKRGPFTVWQHDDGGSTYWHIKVALWRIGVHLTLMRHAYRPGVSDRWVFQSSTTYDRRHIRTTPVRREPA